jgi:hypothetical protein
MLARREEGEIRKLVKNPDTFVEEHKQNFGNIPYFRLNLGCKLSRHSCGIGGRIPDRSFRGCLC